MNRLMGIVTANFTGGSLGALTELRPVASLPIGGRYRLVDFPLSNMVNSGITTVGLVTPCLYRSLLDHVGVGKAWSLSRKVGGLFILPGSVYGVKRAVDKFLLRDFLQNRAILDRGGSDVVAVASADRVMNLDFRKAAQRHFETGADVTLVYREGRPSTGTGLYLRTDEAGEVKELTSEGDKCFLDAFLVNRQLLLSFLDWYAAASHFDLVADIFRENLQKMKVYGYAFRGYCGAVDTLEDYLQVNMDLLSGSVRRELFRGEQPILTKVQDNVPTKYASGAQVRNALISSGCIIGGSVENSVIFRGVEVEPGATVRGCVLLQHTHVCAGAELENIICDKNVTVRAGTRINGGQRQPIVIPKNQEI